LRSQPHDVVILPTKSLGRWCRSVRSRQLRPVVRTDNWPLAPDDLRRQTRPVPAVSATQPWSVCTEHAWSVLRER